MGWGFPHTVRGYSNATGGSLAQATRDKILRGEYVDLFSLLYRELEKKDKDLLDDKEKEILKKRKVDRNWTNWCPVS